MSTNDEDDLPGEPPVEMPDVEPLLAQWVRLFSEQEFAVDDPNVSLEGPHMQWLVAFIRRDRPSAGLVDYQSRHPRHTR